MLEVYCGVGVIHTYPLRFDMFSVSTWYLANDSFNI